MNKRILSFKYALKGIIVCARTQTNFRIHIVALLMALVLGVYYEISLVKWLAILIASGMVISAELINTAIEFLTNEVSPNYNPQAGKVKDISAAAVLITAITAAIIGLIVFVPEVMNND